MNRLASCCRRCSDNERDRVCLYCQYGISIGIDESQHFELLFWPLWWCSALSIMNSLDPTVINLESPATSISTGSLTAGHVYMHTIETLLRTPDILQISRSRSWSCGGRA